MDPEVPQEQNRNLSTSPSFCLVFPNLRSCDTPRTYPEGFGRKLLSAYVASSRRPFRADLRRRFQVPGTSDVEAFKAYPLNRDQWEDARLQEVYNYIRAYKHLVVPEAWSEAMIDFDLQYSNLMATVSWGHPMVTIPWSQGFSFRLD